MLRTEQPEFFKLIAEALAAYVKTPSPVELEAWWATCRVFSLANIDRELKAHAMDPDDGKRAPRPIDLKRRLHAPQRNEQPEFRSTPEHEARMAKYRQDCISSPSVRATAHAIALRHGNRPWQSRVAEYLPDHLKADA